MAPAGRHAARPGPTPAEPAAERSAEAAAPASEPRRGFTLRFESDAALLRLVSRGEASVFVFDGPRALRLGFGPQGAQFTVAASPRSFHAIAPETVPAVLREALGEQSLAAVART